ncbi:ABC transporter ATP-binding protein [Streptosporangium sp. NBC_01755]|uniref:ABC transporter ATP-binding protein n=1 Tax=Streptosporangium sp. NBC_01755 TaxID=2975949 RepID=UPI002DD8F66D|nr:ABC transporter ATP-binding protein [Streptosporangium sp. NBC_01755]WSD01349.1 ABC transporter ATP-binding protein [Streptosporangium sp. NBC_01755]
MTEQKQPIFTLENGSVRYGGGPEAVSDVSVRLYRGEILGLVGESGCGKSTTARAMLGLVPLSGGRLTLHGTPVGVHDRRLRASVQAIFQNPAASFNPKRSLLDSVAEPLRVHGQGTSKERRARALAELDRVGVTEQMAVRRPNEVSGGQCQRAAIARATILRPEVLVCDEPVSALDVSIQAQILELLAELRTEQGLAMLFISHDLGVVASLCDRTAVMYAGRVVEQGAAPDIANRPRHPYSVALQDAVPSLDLTADPEPRIRTRTGTDDVDGRLLPGCRFAALCPSVTSACTATPPALDELSPRHEVACYHPFEPAVR